MYRKLGDNECLTWSYQQIRPMPFVITANIIGAFKLEELQQALVKSQQRHPLLNVQIVLDKSEMPWFKKYPIQIPVRVVERLNPHQWQQEVEKELSNPFDWNQAPLVRVVLLQGENISDLLITCDHAIADGKSAVFLLKDILQSIGLPDQPLLGLLPQESYEQMVPQCIKNPPVSFTPSLSTTQTKPKLPENSRPSLQAWSLSKSETLSIIDRCKKAKTSVHAAICAAFLLAIAELSAPSNTLKCLSPVDIRRFLSIDDDFGYYFVAISTTHNVTPDTSFWDLAYSIKAQLNKKIAPTEIFAHLPALEAFMATSPRHQDVVAMMEMINDNDILVSNLGQLTIPQKYGKLELLTVYGPALTGHINQDLLIGVATLGDQMSLTLVYPESDISYSKVKQLRERAMDLLVA
jgi:NRPS condensation-like uncharacterized protein